MKKLTLLGIGLVLLSVLLFYSSAAQFESNISNNTLQSIIVMPHNSFVAQVQISNNTILGSFYYSNSSNVTYYLLGSKAFNSVSAYLNTTALLNQSLLYRNNGLYEILYHNASGTFPAQIPNAIRLPSYFYNGSAIFGSGTYYNIFQNTGNTSALVYYSIVQKLQVSVNNSILGSTIYGLVAAFTMLAGIFIIGYSVIIKKDIAQKVTADRQQNIDELYAKYDKKPAHKKKKHKRSKQ